MNEFSRFLQRRISVVAVLALSMFVGLLWTVGGGVAEYASKYYGQPQVLGERAFSQFQCVSKEQIQGFLKTSGKTVTLYAPDRTEVVPLDALVGCFTATGCELENFSCEDGAVNVLTQCVQQYFEANPLGAETTRVITGAGASVQVRTHDWSVNYENLAAQLNDAVNKEIDYCQLTGVTESGRKNIGNIQLIVADEFPSVIDSSFTAKFLEIDASKEKAYLWEKGIYQTFKLQYGARVPEESIYQKKQVDLQRLLQSTDLAYVNKQLGETEFVVVHR